MKTNKTLLLFGIFLLLLFWIYKFSTFTLFDEDFKVIKNIDLPNKNYSLKIYFIPSNASSESYIQIRKIQHNEEKILANYKRFDHLDSVFIENDTLIITISSNNLPKSEIKKIKLP